VSNRMKPFLIVLLCAILLTIAGLTFAGQRSPFPKQSPVVALIIIQNPGKDGVIWSVGFDLKSQIDINRRVRVHSQAEAEKMVVLLQETAPGRYVYAGLVVI
jgi:hypothetical protein